MDCPLCQTANPPEAARCFKCDTPLDAAVTLADAPRPSTGITGAETLTPETPGGATLDPGTMKVPEGWSVPAAVSPTVAGSLANLQPGTLLGNRYEILKLLGQGGMGAVYQAKDRELDRMVALKVIRPELAGRPEILQRFKQELILARQVTHKNVIRIYDLGEADGIKFITMQFIEGQDLRTLLTEKGKFPVEEAVGIIQQVCLALEAAHAEGVVHRDLKPQNIMLDSQRKASVMDFGIARSVEPGGMTQTGALMGTPEYMSPEQVRGEHVDARSDLFTLGIIFCELLTGKMPYQAETAMALMFKRTQERAMSVAQLDPSVPKPVSDVVAKCLEIDPKLRYQSATEIRRDLEAWLGTGTVFTARPPALASFPPVRWLLDLPTSRKWIVAGVAVLVLAAGGFALRKLPVRVSFSSGGAAVQPVSLAILPFRNASGDPALDWLGPNLAEMLRTDVGQSAALRTVPADRVHQILKDLRISTNAEFDPGTLQRLAEFSNAQTLVWGQFLKIGEQIRIDATLQDLKRQRVIPVKAEAPSEKDLLKAVEQLAQAIQQNLALSPDLLKELRARTLRPSSNSIPALRAYNEGLELVRTGNNLEAAKRFETATQQDPEFALGYSRLALTYSNLGYDDKAEQMSRKAMELSEKLLEAERYLIEANHAQVLNNTPKAIEAYENLAKVSPDDPDVQFTLAGLYGKAGAFDQALKYYGKVLERDPKHVDALLAVGRVEIRRKNPQGALDYLNRALSLVVELDNNEEKAAILNAMGVAYKRMNKLEEAFRYYQDSLAIKRTLGQKGGIATTLNEMAQIQDRIGKTAEALKSFQEALRLRREIGDKKGIGDTLLDLGVFYADRGQYDEALKLSKESLEIERELGNQNYEALNLNNIGNTYLLKGQYGDALTYFERALQLREKSKIPADIALTLHNVADTTARLGQYDQALSYYLRALDLWRTAGDKRYAAMESYSMASVFESQGRYAAAVNSTEEALKALRELNDRSYWLAEALAAYGSALSKIGCLDEARTNLHEALNLAQELQNKPDVALVLTLQGKNAFYRGDFPAARTAFAQALQMASQTTDRALALGAKVSLAELAVKGGRPLPASASLPALGREADALGLKYLSIECSVYDAEALISRKDYARARQQLETVLGRAEKLGLRALLAQAHYLLGNALRLSGNAAGAQSHYAEALRILDGISKEAAGDTLKKRQDLAPIFQESARWSQPPQK